MAAEQHGDAFGISIRSDWEIPDLPGRGAHSSSYPATRLTTTNDREIRRDWPRVGSETALERRLPDGNPIMVVSRHPEAGFQVWGPRYGRHLVSNDGSEVRSALPRIAAWRWERLLFAQVLPLAAALRGRELFHASAVAIDGGALAFVGLSGAGKSSIAAHLVARGAALVTDDVLALSRERGRVLAFPGAGLAGLDRSELAAMTPSGRARLGRRIGFTHKAYLAAPVARGHVPLRAVYFLARGSGRNIEITRSDSLALQLLSSSFIAYVDRPDQLVQHLDICAHIAATVPALDVASPASVRAIDVAEAVEEHAASLAATAA
jgi:hypothetical protein